MVQEGKNKFFVMRKTMLVDVSDKKGGNTSGKIITAEKSSLCKTSKIMAKIVKAQCVIKNKLIDTNI